MKTSELLYKDESYQIQGAIFDVYKELGSGFLESVYQECLELEFKSRNIPFHSHIPLSLEYKGEVLTQKFIPDFSCYEDIIVEIKAVEKISNIHKAQIINYLKATNCQLGLLINFGHYPKVEIFRFLNTY